MKQFHLMSCCFLWAILLFHCGWAEAQIPAFPGAEGFGVQTTTGGRGGQVIKVTTLDCEGPGSLNAALNVPGPKYILFTVSGIIDCAAEVDWGDCYIAGQTSPGGIIVRGLYLDDYYEPGGKAQNVIVRHLNSRPNTTAVRPGTGIVLDDALRLDGAKNIVIDHCSFANATDECIQISRSSNIAISRCQLAETLGEHYDLGGMLMNYSVANFPLDSISLHHNVWNRLGGRMPEISCEDSFESPGDNTCLTRPWHLEFSNNLLWDIPIQIYYDAQPGGYHDLFANFVNNQAVGRPAYCGPMFNFALLNNPDSEFFTVGNTMVQHPMYSDYEIFYCCNDFCTEGPNTNPGVAAQRTTRFDYPPLGYSPTASLRTEAIQQVGAFNGHSPDHRDSMNRRLLFFLEINAPDTHAVAGTDFWNDGFLLDFSNPPLPPTDSDADGMPDDWEMTNGLNPSVQDHNGTGLSIALTGISGYTNLECYLNQLADNLVATAFGGPVCALLTSPANTSTDVPANAALSWSAANGATGYRLDVGTVPGGTDILNNFDVGNVTTFDPPGFFPYGTAIYVRIKPYNSTEMAVSCPSQRFTTGHCIPGLQVINWTVPTGVYKSLGELVSHHSTISNGTVVSFLSDSGVWLGEDFVVEEGGVFEVLIQPCNN